MTWCAGRQAVRQHKQHKQRPCALVPPAAGQEARAHDHDPSPPRPPPPPLPQLAKKHDKKHDDKPTSCRDIKASPLLRTAGLGLLPSA
jgi:hypothetical protein